MKNTVARILRLLSVVALGLAMLTGVAHAQQPTPSPTPKKAEAKPAATPAEAGEDAGHYIVVGSIEFGYRGLRVRGDHNKYQSDLNYKAGPRLFDSSFFARSKDGKSVLFDTLMVTSTGWGGDPYGNLRVSAEKPKWYRFDASYRRFKYFNFLNNLANPSFATQPPSLVTGDHGYDVRQKFADFDLTLLPKNEKIRFNVGFSPETYGGPGFTTYHVGGDDFILPGQFRSRSRDFRIGADGKVGPIDFSLLQGFRRFRDDSFINSTEQNLGANPALSNAFLTSITRDAPTRGQVNYTRLSAHTLVAGKLDVTARIVYSNATSVYRFIENMTGINFNTRITGVTAPPNILNLGQYDVSGNNKRPNTLGDLGVTYLATDKLRISNTFRVETFQLNGGAIYNSTFIITRAAPPLTQIVLTRNLSAYEATKYRKIQDTVEFDYQFNPRHSLHFGYRFGSRRIEEITAGYAIGSNAPTLSAPTDVVEHNHTNAFFGGFKARPLKGWTLYFDAEHGTADNVFSRIGNYNYTNFRAKSRYAPNHKWSINLGLVTRNNANPSEIAGVSLNDFGVSIKSWVFSSAIDWMPNSKLSFSTGYNFSSQNSDAVVNYFFNSINHPVGHSQYFMRNNFFYFDTTAQLAPRVMLYTSYRINKDNGQGIRTTDPTGTPGFLISSYPMSYQSPEARLTVKINRRVDWNLGYQYYNYNESAIVGPRPQNYHAHLPYTSLRIYIGRRE